MFPIVDQYQSGVLFNRGIHVLLSCLMSTYRFICGVVEAIDPAGFSLFLGVKSTFVGFLGFLHPLLLPA